MIYLFYINKMEAIDLRIINGKYKGKRLFTLSGLNTRPMLTRIKQNLFNVLDNYFYFENKIGLDIFAGSGSLGLEALSRGLKFCYFNDLNRDAITIINKNITYLNIASNDYNLFCWEYQQLLNYLVQAQIKLDLIFIDPPFKNIKSYEIIISFILNNNILNANGIIVCESNCQLNINLNWLIIKNYKEKYLYFYRKEQN